MAAIQLTELTPAGYALLQDTESFLQELSEDEMGISGGKTYSIVIGTVGTINSNISILGNTVITANANSINANTISNVNTVVSAFGL